MFKAFLLIAVFISSANAAQNIIFDHDAGVDDFVALSLASCDPNYNINAITIAPADSYKKTAIEVTKKLVDFAGMKNVQISASDFEGTNVFPATWREHSDLMAALPIFAQINNNKTNAVLPVDSHKHLVDLLSKKEKFIIIATGPLSNIAEALKINPKIKENISRIYYMGGAVRVAGNVDEKKHDKTAEWNVYNNPEATDIVVRSGIPMTLVPLDATQYVPVSVGFMEKLKRQQSPASRVVYEVITVLNKYIELESVYFWDTLTAAVALDPTLLTTERMKVKVVTDGVSQGRTLESNYGTEIDVALKVDRARFEKFVLSKLDSCKWNKNGATYAVN
jgi:purine nucleosidase